MKKVAVILMMLTMSFMACKKESPKTAEVENVESAVVMASPRGSTGPGNPDNRYDEAGRIHNYVLEQIEEHRLAGEDMNLENSTKLVQDIYSELNLPVPSKDFYATIPQTIEAALEDIHGLIIDRANCSKSVKDELHNMIRVLEKHADETDYKNVKEVVMEFERKIMDSDMQEEERSIVLQAASVARYSAYYWMNNAVFNVPVAGRGFWEWLVVTGADIGGFIESFNAGYAGECSDQVRTAFALSRL